MRFDKNQDGTTAADLIKSLSENELANIIFQFGEEEDLEEFQKLLNSHQNY